MDPCCCARSTSGRQVAQSFVGPRRAQRVATAAQVWTSHGQGWTLDAIAEQVGLSRRTVQRYLQCPTFPERHPRHGRGRSLLDPYQAALPAGWNHGCRRGWHLFRTIRRQGFRGQYGIVALYVRRLRQAWVLAPRQRRSDQPLPAVAEAPWPRLTPRRATWLVLRPPERASAQDYQPLAQLTTQGPELAEAVALAQDFAAIVHQRQPTHLEPWLARPARSALPPFRQRAPIRHRRRPSCRDPALEPGPHRGAHQSPENVQAPDVWPGQARSAGPTFPPGSMTRHGAPTAPSPRLHSQALFARHHQIRTRAYSSKTSTCECHDPGKIIRRLDA
jgi:hypothetical protein